MQATITGGVATPVKMFAMGRGGAEVAVVMPDQMTAYMTVEGNFKPFLKFVANTAGDLTEGCLFTARLVQTGNLLAQGNTSAS